MLTDSGGWEGKGEGMSGCVGREGVGQLVIDNVEDSYLIRMFITGSALIT